ncbi:hypothetical protein L1049_017956 [Liquidambar formosana]|uniref:Uncharacterized protein n=1 Tax=Liquidambar formosana TaxID=63359 RepID=A0AAP0R8U9_LIQFO
MKIVGSTLAYLLFCLTSLILFIFFSVSFSVSREHHELVISTYKLIRFAKSSPMVVLLVCHVITIAIFLGRSSKEPSGADFDWFFSHPPMVYHAVEDIDGEEETKGNEDDNDDNNKKDDEDSDIGNHGCDGYDEDNDDGSSDDDYDSQYEGVDSDLERRIEEFIARVNSKWREELLNEKLLCFASAEFQYLSSSG